MARIESTLLKHSSLCLGLGIHISYSTCCKSSKETNGAYTFSEGQNAGFIRIITNSCIFTYCFLSFLRVLFKGEYHSSIYGMQILRPQNLWEDLKNHLKFFLLCCPYFSIISFQKSLSPEQFSLTSLCIWKLHFTWFLIP